MKPNQYVVCKEKEGKPFLARIEKVREDGVLVVPQKDVQYQRNVIEVDKKIIKAVLGENPVPGTVYGFDMHNLFRKTIEHDFWGSIHFFIHPDKDTMKLLKKGLDDCAKIITKLDLAHYATSFETEIRAKKGKYAGMYKHTTTEGKPNTVWYAPECAKGSAEFMNYVILHEFGHALRFNGLKTNKMRNKWLRLYQRTIAQVKVEAKTLKGILHDLADFDEEQESFKGALNGATQDAHPRIQKAITQWLKETHKINPRELEIMWRASKLEDIQKYWPDHMIDTHDLKPKVSEYATKNVEELFAECFAFYAMGKKLPDVCTTLLEDSLSRIRAERDRD